VVVFPLLTPKLVILSDERSEESKDLRLFFNEFQTHHTSPVSGHRVVCRLGAHRPDSRRRPACPTLKTSPILKIRPALQTLPACPAF
jgi:hypothetical protein